RVTGTFSGELVLADEPPSRGRVSPSISPSQRLRVGMEISLPRSGSFGILRWPNRLASLRRPAHNRKEKTMIFHINRMTWKADLSEEQRRAGLELLRQAGAANPAVTSYVVGPELGGEFEYSAVYVVEDLDGYWEYLTHPAHVRSEL